MGKQSVLPKFLYPTGVRRGKSWGNDGEIEPPRIDIVMDNGITPADGDHAARYARLFSRYTTAKMDRFHKWLATPHGQRVYSMFAGFARQWYESGNDRCGASLIGNRLRWEISVGEYNGHKIPNDFVPMLARELVADDPVFDGMFSFHRTLPAT